MARRRKSKEKELDDLLFGIFLLVVVTLGYWAWKNTAQVILWGSIFLGVLFVSSIIYIIYRKKHKKRINDRQLSDDNILHMFRGMSYTEFEEEVARIFSTLGFETKTKGGANDGGVDVVARKDGKKYYIQCKRYNKENHVTPHDIRDFLGAITNINDPAEKGYFVSSGTFTLMAEKAAEGNPRIELIDGLKLVEYYRLAYGESDSSEQSKEVHPAETVCPECGSALAEKSGKYGKFLGCSSYPECHYTRAIN